MLLGGSLTFPEFDFLVKEPELDTLTEAVRKRLHSARSD